MYLGYVPTTILVIRTVFLRFCLGPGLACLPDPTIGGDNPICTGPSSFFAPAHPASVIMQALHQEILPPSGVEYAATLKLTPATLADSAIPSTSTSYPHPSQGALYNVVVARANILRVFEVTESPAPMSQQQDERNRRADVPRGTEAVEGEVEMDGQGEGFVNMGSVKVTWNIYVDDSPLPNDSHLSLPFYPISCAWT